jgi:hypothetical protein
MGILFFLRILKGFYKSFIWAFVILFLCMAPSNKISRFIIFSFVHFDLIAHFIFYFILALILYIDIFRYFKGQGKQYVIIMYTILIPLLWGIMIELLQYFIVASRAGTVSDVAANLGGTIISLFTILAVKKYFLKPGL